MSLSKYASTKETTNLARVARIIFGPCTDILRDVLCKEMSSAALSHNVKTFLSNLPKHTKPPITKKQEQLIYGEKSLEFDITLLYTLLRNISQIQPHNNEWGNAPSQGDRSLSANIERIHLIRNQYAHFPSISDSNFEQSWKNIFQAVKEIEGYLGTLTTYQNALIEIRSCSMDPEEEQKCLQKLQIVEHLQNDYDTLKGEIEVMKKSAVPWNVKESYKKHITAWKLDDRFFLETHNYPAMFEKVRKQTYVTFVGVPGSGKTATARHIVLKLQEEGYEILPITDKNKIEDYCDPHNPQVFLIDDVVGVFGLDMTELNLLFKYKNRFTKSTMPNIKILMTCREAVYRSKTLKSCFLSKKENVVQLHSDENALNDKDKHDLLLMYNLDTNLLSPNSMTLASKMFPFLCKIFSKKKEFTKHGKDFFIAPVPCFLERLEEMKYLNKIQYASLTLLMINQNKLSKEDLEKEQNEKKTLVLRKCEVNSMIDSFELANSLSEMEGTYTQKCGNIFSFVHDSMFTIMAYHFGCKFPEMILQYMSSNYIAHYIKFATYRSQKSESDEEERTYASRTEENETREEFYTFEHSRVKDLCITLSDEHFPMLADRLLKDVRNGKFFNVFMNEALKDKKLLTAFIEAMKNKTYEELYSLFLSEFKDSSQEINYSYRVKEDVPCQHLNILIGDQLCCSKFCIVRAISWVIFYGHHQILDYIIERIMKEKGNLTDLFQNDHRKDQRCFSDLPEEDTDNKKESMLENVFSHCKSKNDIQNNSDVSREIESYCEPASIEQYRLLCLACFAGYIEIVKILLKYISRDIFMKNFKFQENFHMINKPFVIACKFGNADIVMEFLKAGANVNLHDDSQTPLTAACKNGHLGVVELLIEAGTDVNLRVEDQSQQQADCEESYLNVDKELIKTGDDVNLMNENNAAIKNTRIDDHFCAAKKMTKSVPYFSHQNVNKTPLIIACEEDNLNLVKMLIKAKASVNLDDGENTPLTIACEQGLLEFVKELLKAGADVNLKDISKTPLTAACYYGRIDIVESLVEAGADVNVNDGKMSPLTAACIDGELKVVEILIRAGAMINLNGGDKTPLTAACEAGDLNIVNTFLKEGADVNLSDGKKTPLTAVCVDGDITIVKALIKAGADVNLHDGTRTPLAAAYKWGRSKIIQELIKAGADINRIT